MRMKGDGAWPTEDTEDTEKNPRILSSSRRFRRELNVNDGGDLRRGCDRANKKGPPFGRALQIVSFVSASLLLRAALELRGELFHATGSIDQTLFARISGVRVHRHVTRDDEILFTIDLLLAGGL